MKKRILMILFIVFFCIFSVCTTMLIYANAESKPNSLTEVISEEKEWEIGRMDNLISKNLNKKFEELPVYSFSRLSLCVGRRGIVLPMNIVGDTLTWFNDAGGLKVENIQKINDNLIAVVYKVADENIDPALMFVMFKREIFKEENYETWIKTGEAYFLDNVLNSKDYLKIKIGESIENLYSVDKSIYYDVLRKELSSNVLENLKQDNIRNNDLANAPRMIYKLLSDGILTIEYNVETKIIVGIKFYSYEQREIPFGVSFCSSVLVNCVKQN